ncbi:MAG: COG1280: Putative threonine efflux protein [uncultured Solirubrobacteraceae bacterium]|uniref:COG1280: Putative threonine efflux protein n=1 Tax=uncultured Solirubrobacteraceae bacterium TaxID=1162706 RepID=A0A6J4TMJ6_9ACTN|nr:MAG: COG1280: Putative threonine efflux protein [uncultured Solirubrobacteraceae bacterium]
MDLVASLPAFVVAVILISASPGPAMALILRRAALGGFRGAVPTVLGLEAGLYLWALAAAAGFAALVAASEVAFVVLRVVGAIVLLALGARALRAAWAARRTPDEGAVEAEAPAAEPLTRRGWWRAFAEGAVVQLANPKAAVFMIAFYPQFVPADRPLFATTAVLGLLQVAIEIVIYLSLAAGVGRARAWFMRPAVRRRLEAVSGTVLIALGLRVATQSR